MTRIKETLPFMSTTTSHPNWNEIEPILQDEIVKAIKGEKDSIDALEDTKKRIDNLNN